VPKRAECAEGTDATSVPAELPSAVLATLKLRAAVVIFLASWVATLPLHHHPLQAAVEIAHTVGFQMAPTSAVPRPVVPVEATVATGAPAELLSAAPDR